MTERRRLPGGHLAQLREGLLLQNAIGEAGLTQSQFARRVGCHRSMISALILGTEIQIKEELGAAICWVADCQPSRLFVMPTAARGTGHDDPSGDADG